MESVRNNQRRPMAMLLFLLTISSCSGRQPPNVPPTNSSNEVNGIQANSKLTLDNGIWGARIWEKDVDEEHKLVVDERGVADSPQDGNLLGLTYYWRFISKNGGDGQILFKCLGYPFNSGIGRSTRGTIIRVLFTGLFDGDLATVYNQGGKCLACIVHQKTDGTVETRPGAHGDPFLSWPDRVVGSSMETAEITKQPDGVIQLITTDAKNQTFRFNLSLDNRWVHPD